MDKPGEARRRPFPVHSGLVHPIHSPEAGLFCYCPGKEVGQAFQPDKAQSQAGKPDLVRL